MRHNYQAVHIFPNFFVILEMASKNLPRYRTEDVGVCVAITSWPLDTARPRTCLCVTFSVPEQTAVAMTLNVDLAVRAMMMETVLNSEASVYFHETKLCENPESYHLHTRRHENLIFTSIH
jgi:hypothetical protein